MSAPRLTLRPRRAQWFLGEPVVFDLTLENPGPTPLTVPHPMRPGATAPQYRLTLPDGTVDAFVRADEVPGASSPLVLGALERWRGELVLRPGRAPLPGAYTLEASVPNEALPLAADPVVFEVIPRRFSALWVSLALGPGGEVTREALLLDDPAGHPSVVAAPLRETNPRLGEGAAGPLLPRGALSPNTPRVVAPTARHDLGLDPQRWVVAPSPGGILLRSNLHPDPAVIPWPGTHGYPWAALQGPGNVLHVLAHWGSPSGASVGVLRAVATASGIGPLDPVVLGAMPPGLLGVAGALSPPSAASGAPEALWAVVVCDSSQDPSLETTVLGWRLDLGHGATVEAFRTVIPGVRPLGTADAWSDAPERARGAFLGVDVHDQLWAFALAWSEGEPAAVALDTTALGVGHTAVVDQGLTLWSRDGVPDLLVWIRTVDGGALIAYQGQALRPVRCEVRPGSPLGFVPGVDRWYAVHLSDDPPLAMDPA